jgi:hypothetical protein
MTVMTQQIIASLTADGGSNGILTFADTSLFEVGATCYLSATGLPTVSLLVDAILSSTQLAVKIYGQYTRFPSSAYTVALSAKLTQPQQVDFLFADNGQEIPVGGSIILDGPSANSFISFDGTNINITAPIVATRLGTAGFTDISGTPGSGVGNTAKGRAAMANAASTMTVTNSLVTANDVVNIQWETALGAGITHIVVPTAGSFTVTTSSAVTGAKILRWSIA